MGQDQEIQFKNGSGLFYYDKDHSYWRRNQDGTRGRRLTGVTTGIKPIDFKPDNLMKWAARMNGIGIAELIGEALACEDIDELKNALSWATNHESIWSTLESSKLTYNDVRDRAGKRGTNVHELAMESLALGKPTPDYDRMTDEERGYAKGVTQFWLDYDPEPLNVEQIVYSERLGVAGRMDLRARMGGIGPGGGPGIAIVDLKTSTFIGPSAHVQVAGYDYCAMDCAIGGSDAQYILHVHEDGSYEFIKSVATHEDFLRALDLYRRSGRIDREAKGAWLDARRAQEARAAA